jgi:uncharacterized membrane protein YdjX (TVP38/TMEM64 family)
MILTMSSTQKRLLVTAAILTAIVGGGAWTRSQLGIEFDVDSVRAFAESLGPTGPMLFVLVVAGRSLLALPSQIVLIAAGLCFGTGVGAIVGGTGLMLSGLGLFLIARYAGREWVENRVNARGHRLLDYMTHRSGAVTLALACGYPITPLSPIQMAAGLTPMPIANFMVAAFLGGLMRASIFAYFGNTLAEFSMTSLVYATGLFVVMIGMPLALPSGREWLREVFATGPIEEPSTED